MRGRDFANILKNFSENDFGSKSPYILFIIFSWADLAVNLCKSLMSMSHLLYATRHCIEYSVREAVKKKIP